MRVIGLTGPTGAGKSEVNRLFASFGLPILDADCIYHDLLLPPSKCLDELVQAFGRNILQADGSLNRKALGKIVFSDADERKRLNEIAHRHVMGEIRAQIDTYRTRGVPAVILDAPQLFEAGAEKDCDYIVSVLADKETRIARILSRDGITREAALERIGAQYSDDFFIFHSNAVIENDGSLADLLPKVKRILTEAGVLL